MKKNEPKKSESTSPGTETTHDISHYVNTYQWPISLGCWVFQCNIDQFIELAGGSIPKDFEEGVLHAINSLSEIHSKILLMRFKEKLSILETANQLGEGNDRSSVQSLTKHALGRLGSGSRRDYFLLGKAEAERRHTALESEAARLEAEEAERQAALPILEKSVVILDLEPYIQKILRRNKLLTIGDVAGKTQAELRYLRNSNQAVVVKIQTALSKFDVELKNGNET